MGLAAGNPFAVACNPESLTTRVVIPLTVHWLHYGAVRGIEAIRESPQFEDIATVLRQQLANQSNFYRPVTLQECETRQTHIDKSHTSRHQVLVSCEASRSGTLNW